MISIELDECDVVLLDWLDKQGGKANYFIAEGWHGDDVLFLIKFGGLREFFEGTIPLNDFTIDADYVSLWWLEKQGILRLNAEKTDDRGTVEIIKGAFCV